MIRKSRNNGNSTRKARRFKVEWLTLGLILGCYGLWFIAGFSYGSMPILTFLLLPLMNTFHSSLQHEALHGHPTRNAKINEALVFFPIALFYPFRRYKNLHLRHHADERLTDPYDDPESYYRALVDWQRLPDWFKSILRLNNTLIGRVLIGPAIAILSCPMPVCLFWRSGPSASISGPNAPMGGPSSSKNRSSATSSSTTICIWSITSARRRRGTSCRASIASGGRNGRH
jgi:hypothetical protein